MSSINTTTDTTLDVVEADHQLGSRQAAVTLLEYGDYECPDCFNSEPVVGRLRELFPDTLRVVFRHYPRNSVHPRSSAAAEAAEAAAAQGKFWDMHRALFAHQKELADLDLTHLALSLGLDVYRFERDVTSPAVARHVRADFETAEQSGVRGTPTFFINGKRHQGPTDLETLSTAIRQAGGRFLACLNTVPISVTAKAARF